MEKVHSISWNLTRRCNLRCAHCYLDASSLQDEAKGELTLEECLRTIDQIALVNPHTFLILTGGEPLLREDIFEIAHYASCRGFTVVLGTNGTLIDPSLPHHPRRRSNPLPLSALIGGKPAEEELRRTLVEGRGLRSPAGPWPIGAPRPGD